MHNFRLVLTEVMGSSSGDEAEMSVASCGYANGDTTWIDGDGGTVWIGKEGV
jgi:hypothetical protein